LARTECTPTGSRTGSKSGNTFPVQASADWLAPTKGWHTGFMPPVGDLSGGYAEDVQLADLPPDGLAA